MNLDAGYLRHLLLDLADAPLLRSGGLVAHLEQDAVEHVPQLLEPALLFRREGANVEARGLLLRVGCLVFHLHAFGGEEGFGQGKRFPLLPFVPQKLQSIRGTRPV